MTRQQDRPYRCRAAAFFLAGFGLAGGCGSDASSSSNPSNAVGPSGPLVAERYEKHPPPPPPRPQTKEECDACQGLWAVHGIAQVESCICRTCDANEPCTDGRDCEGQCLVDIEAGFQVTDPSDPPRGFYTGTCSPYDTTFGCIFVIPPGIEDELPLPAEAAVQHICVD